MWATTLSDYFGQKHYLEQKIWNFHPCTAIPYRTRTGPEQGFPSVVILTGKTMFSLQGTPFLIAGILYSLQGFSCENYYTGRSL
jgi:hypothetical protein